MHPDWPRTLRDQCEAEEVPFFFKQWGEYLDHIVNESGGEIERMAATAVIDDLWRRGLVHKFDDGTHVARVGKKAAGRLLDGKEWNQMPHGDTPHDRRRTA